jgi:ferredoxin
MLTTLSTAILLGFSLLIFLGFVAFGFVSLAEGERRAMWISFGLAILGAGFFAGAAFAPPLLRGIVVGALGVLFLALVILFSLPIGRVEGADQQPDSRFDEREIMFARARLEPGSAELERYYSEHPEHKAADDRFRALPGLLSKRAKFYDPFGFAAIEASFYLTESLREAVDGPVAAERVQASPEEMTLYLKRLAHFYGALNVGVTALEPYHVYSHIGRGAGEYGAPISLEHTHAIAFTVEMDFEMVMTAPRAPTSMETAKEYVEAARVAVQLAQAIREMGYEARAHIDGNYRLIAPLVARDAGLGEIGRMGLLMSPKEGPRLRLGVVTTTLELISDPREPNRALIDFCNICKKCAQNCPSRSIPFDDRREIDGALRWRIDSDTCFRYWNRVGTDCARCMAVCPYAHPDNWAHNLVRRGIQRSGFFRRLALWLDDLFYGHSPAVKPGPGWLADR